MQSNNGYSYFFLGLSVGAAAALLFAPKAGAETRNYLQSKAEDAAESLKDQGQRAMDLASQSVERAKGTLREQADTVSHAVDAGKQAYEAGRRAFNERAPG